MASSVYEMDSRYRASRRRARLCLRSVDGRHTELMAGRESVRVGAMHDTHLRQYVAFDMFICSRVL